MLNTINTKFATQEANNLEADRLIKNAQYKMDIRKKKFNIASHLETFGGKRFLGLTPKGVKVFASYTINKENMTLDIEFTHKLNVLLQEGAKLAGQRYSYPLNAKVFEDNDTLTRKRKIPSGEVTVQTLHHLQRLKELSDIKYYKAYDGIKVTKYFFTTVAMAIFTGGMSINDVDYHDITKTWEFSEYSPYFVPESTWKYPDEL